MKIRTGFVSNSSSSSFVIAFPHRPKSVKDLKKIMFGKQEWHYVGLYGGTQDTPVMPIIEAVFKEVKGKKSADKKKVYEAICHGWFDSYIIPELFPGHMSSSERTLKLNYQDEKDRKEINRIWEETDKINNERANAIADAFMDAHKDSFLAVMEFCDNDSEFWSIMEHSGIFERVDHIQTSYH